MRPISSCALCLELKSLAQSHIIPNFLLKETEDWVEEGKARQEQPHMILVDYNTTQPISSGQRGKVLKEEGLLEYMLCESCENLISIGENYARVCLYGRDPTMKHTRPAKSSRRYRTRRGKILREGFDARWVDYEKFKQFQISLIWRACAAKGKAFNAVRASPATVELMRLALLNGRFDEALVPCAMELLDDPTGTNLGFVACPVVEGSIVQFVMGGYRWSFYMNRDFPIECVLRNDGWMFVKVSDIDCFYTPDEMLKIP